MIKDHLDSLLQYRFLCSTPIDLDSPRLGRDQKCAAAATSGLWTTP